MLIRKRGIPVIFFIGLAAFSVWSVFAYVLSGQDWTHQTNPMGEDYVVEENCGDCTGEANAILRAATTWNNACARFRFSSGGTTSSCNAPSYDQVNCIRWGILANGVLATTTWWYNTTTGDIFEADCVFNDNYTWSTAATTPSTEYDVETVMLHEFGHYLSLGHSTAPAIMQPTVSSGTQRRTLTDDDIKGIRAIYGSKSHACCSTITTAKAGASEKGFVIFNVILLLSPLIVISFFRLRKKNRKIH